MEPHFHFPTNISLHLLSVNNGEFFLPIRISAQRRVCRLSQSQSSTAKPNELLQVRSFSTTKKPPFRAA
jgi:hypothetical protein